MGGVDCDCVKGFVSCIRGTGENRRVCLDLIKKKKNFIFYETLQFIQDKKKAVQNHIIILFVTKYYFF